MCISRINSTSPRRGFVLLMTLVLLALAAVSLAAVSRHSLSKAVQAIEAQQQLQRRWGAYSCIHTLLPQVERQLQRTEEKQSDAAPMVRLELELAEHRYDVVLADEQAKANVNALHDRLGQRDAEQAVGTLLTASASPARAALSPLPAILGAGQMRRYTSPAQFLERVEPRDLDSALANLTCWGDGKLNVCRASAPAIEAVTKPMLDLGQIDKLISLRHEIPGADIDRLLTLLNIEEQQQQKLKDLLTGGSRCHSLWLTIERDDRQWQQVAVLEQGGSSSGGAKMKSAGMYSLQW